MRRIILHMLLCICLSLTSTSAIWANQVIIGYCNGQIANSEQGSIVGQSGNNSYISAAIHLGKEQLDEYRAGNAKLLRYGFPSGITLPSAVTLWVRTSQNGDNISETTIAPAAGWNEYEMPEAISLSAVEDLWVGMTYLQNKKLNVLSLVGETHPEGCYVAKGKNWSSLADTNAGSLSIELVAESDDYLTNDLSLQEIIIPSNYCRWGDELIVSGTIKNNAINAAKPLLHWEMCGQQGEITLDKVLNYRESQYFSFGIPTTKMTEGETQLRIELLWADGTQDQKPTDNVWETYIEVSSQVAVRRMVCEEGTGLWCGWCVRGIVGLEQMTLNHPDTFIGISAHNGDIFEVKDYSDWVANTMNSGFPGSIINRKQTCDPGFESLQKAYETTPDYSPYDISIIADFPEQDQYNAMQTYVSATATVMTLANIEEHNLRLAIVITEDSLYGMQNNDYSGGSKEMDGWELKDKSVFYPLPHVARAIAPSIEGDKEALPSALLKGETYEYTRKVPLPQIQYDGQSVRFVNTNQLAAIALLIDGKTGEILNAAKVKNQKKESEEAIRNVKIDQDSDGQYFTTDGRAVRRNTSGYMISKKGKILLLD